MKYCADLAQPERLIGSMPEMSDVRARHLLCRYFSVHVVHALWRKSCLSHSEAMLIGFKGICSSEANLSITII